jgi:MYXO-CTERM domain-containing protein
MRRAGSRAARGRGLWVIAALTGLSSPALAAGGRVACSTLPDPSGRSFPGSNRGPCSSPDAVDYFTAGSSGRGMVVTNFGILVPGAGSTSWQIVCDDNFGFAPPPRVRLHPDGRVFAASYEGLYQTSDGCAWSRATVDNGVMVTSARIFFDVAFDPQTPGQIFGLGEVPRELWRSTDGGRTFTLLRTFDQTLAFHRLVVAPSDGKRLYLFGLGRMGSTPYARSDDGGQTFEFGDLTAALVPRPLNAFELVAVAPDDPSVLYFSVINPTDGDEIWRSTDGGTTVEKFLQLETGEAFSGFTFGATPRTVYVAGTDPFPLSSEEPPAHLYVTRDGGESWSDPVPSGPGGPRYRCLSWSAEKLYACGAGEQGGDPFLIGSSTDEGKTWVPAVRLQEFAGAKSCVQAQCLRTEEWLCENYCYCAPGLQPSTGSCVQPGDGGAPRPDGGGSLRDAPADTSASEVGPGGDACVGTACLEQQGCSCRLGAAPASRPGLAGLLAAAVLLALGGRRRHARR